MKKFLIYSLFIITLLISGCSEKTAVAIPKKFEEYPEWYLKPKQNDNNYMYAVAIGSDKEEATLIALKEIASQFGVEIESNYESKENLNTKISSHLNTEVDQNIKSKVGLINITNFEVTNFYKLKYNKFIIEIKVDKTKLFSSLLEDVIAKTESFKRTIASLSKSNYLVKIINYKKMFTESTNLYKTLKSLKYLNTNFETSKYTLLLNNIENKYLNYKNNLEAKIIYDKNSNFLKGEVESFLVKNGFKIVNKITSEKTFLIKFNTNISNDKSTDFNFVVYSVEMLLSVDNQLIANNNFLLKENYKQNKNLLESVTVNHFIEELEKKGLENIFRI